MWTNSRKKYSLIFLFVLLIGLILGIIFVINLRDSLFENISSNLLIWQKNLTNFHFNNILPHLLLIPFLLILSLYFIGLPLNIFYIFYNGFSIGFIISCLTKLWGFNGLLYGFCYCFINKGIFILLLFLLYLLIMNVVEKNFHKIFKKDIHGTSIIKNNFKKCGIIYIIIFINDLLIYFLGGKFLNIFNFLLK